VAVPTSLPDHLDVDGEAPAFAPQIDKK